MPKKAKQPPSKPNEPYDNEKYDYCNDVSFICAVRVFDNKNPKVFKNCAAKAAQIGSCHTLQDAEVKLFELIDEKKLYPYFDKKMEEFVIILNTELKNNEDMKQKIKSLYNFESDDNILRAVSEHGPNEHNCNDITGFVNLNTLPPEKYPLFHISIHPKASKYYKKSGTEAASCGYYSKKEHSQGSGAFHYKIETLANGAETTLKNKPFKKFMTADDDPGKFIKNEDKFVVKEELKTHATDELHELHKFFYNEFIDFWNNRIVIDPTFRRSEPEPEPEPEPPAPAVPEQPMPEAQVALVPSKVPSKRASQDQPLIDPSEATEELEHERKSSRIDSDQPLKTSGEGKRIRRKTNKKRKTIKKRKTKKRKTIKRKPIKKRNTSKR
jgi:hypothetical protein